MHKTGRSIRTLVVLLVMLLGFLALPLAGAAQPKHFPDNPNACVGHSATAANAALQATDRDKHRSDQARADDGQPGRADAIATLIPECTAAGVERGHVKN